MKTGRFLVLMLAMLLIICQTVTAEDTYINLDDRFDSVLQYEYNGTTYYEKNRVDTTLVMCANPSEEGAAGAGSVELILLIPIDDDTKTTSPVQLEAAMTAAWLEGEDAGKTLGELFGEAEDIAAGSVRVMEAVNALFPKAMIEHYAVLDLNGLPKLDGIENNETNTTGEELVERLKAIKNTTEQDPDADLNGMLSSLSGYIITDLKSGAMVKIVDKVDRYERFSRKPFPVLEPADEAAVEILPDMDAFEAMMIGVYFTDTRAW